MAKRRAARPVNGGQGLCLAAALLVVSAPQASGVDWINWGKVFAEPTTTTTTTSQPSFGHLFCKNFPKIPVACKSLAASLGSTNSTKQAAQLNAPAAPAPAPGPQCSPNDPRCCKASSCFSVPVSGLGCWEQRGSTKCVGAGLSFNGGVFFKRGVCMCKSGLCSQAGHCPDAPDKTAAIMPGAHTFMPAQSKFEQGEREEVPPENVERTLFVLALAALCAVAASATLSLRFFRRLLRPHPHHHPSEAEPVPQQAEGEEDSYLATEKAGLRLQDRS